MSATAETATVTTLGTPRIARVMLFFLRTFGLWHPSASLPYRLYSYALHLTCTLLYVLSLIVGIFGLHTNNELISASAMTTTLVALNVKVFNLYRNNAKIRACLRTIAAFRLNEENGDQESRILAHGVRLFSTVATALYAVGNSAGASQYAAAYVAGHPPFAAWYPAAAHTHPMVWYWYQVGAMLMLSNLNMTMELFPSYLMYMISVQMRILGERLRRLGAGVQYAGRFGAAETASQWRARRELIACIRTHQEVLGCVDQVQEGFTVGFFAQITASAAIVCAMAVQLTIVSRMTEKNGPNLLDFSGLTRWILQNSPRDDGAAYAYYLTFFCSIVAQCCLPCFFGHEVITSGELLPDAAYAAEWTQMSPSFRRLLVVFMERVKRTSVIRAGKMFPLSLDTFRAVGASDDWLGKVSCSYFSVFQIMSFTYKLYALVANVN